MTVAYGLRDVYCGEINDGHVGAVVSVCGWVARIRDHGEHLVFVDLRDHTGQVQCVVEKNLNIRPEFVLKMTGTVSNRPNENFNEKLATGRLELKDCKIEVLNSSEPLPFPLNSKVGVDESLRLKYRFLDIRSDRMQKNLRLRHKIVQTIRNSMSSLDFLEVDTPLLWMPTPEGAREFLVPSRLQKGHFYSLPQSPQIAKQLLMVAGIDRYFQIAKCLRDEDLRADRQFEFTQLDLEASFVTQNEIIQIVTSVIRELFMNIFGHEPEPIETITWEEAMSLYGTDKPDLRVPLRIRDLTQYFKDTKVNALKGVSVQALLLKKAASISRAKLDEFVAIAKRNGGKGLLWIRVTEDQNGLNLDSPISKFLEDSDKSALINSLNPEVGDLILIVSDEKLLSCQILHAVKSFAISQALVDILVPEDQYRFIWVTDFPMFESLDEKGNAVAAHHPFTMPNEEDLDLLLSEPLKVRSSAYDLVLNGWELGSGSVRIHQRDIQERVFTALGMSIDEAYDRFGFMLNAFRFGAPPHAGFGLGLDRLVAIFANEPSIREVIAFPKSQSGIDLMTSSPTAVDKKILKELGIISGEKAGGGTKVKDGETLKSEVSN